MVKIRFNKLTKIIRILQIESIRKQVGRVWYANQYSVDSIVV